MKWIVTFLDTIVLVYFLSGIVVWEGAFPDYIRSEFAQKFSENGVEGILFVNENPYIQFLHPPECFYDIVLKEKGKSSYRPLAFGYFGQGRFGSDGCSVGMDVPLVNVIRTANGFNVVSVFRKKQYYFDENVVNLYILPKTEINTSSVVNLLVRWQKVSEDSVVTEGELLRGYMDDRPLTICRISVSDYKEAPEDSLKRMSEAFFSDSARVNALYDAFKQMNLKSNCLDSLVRKFGK